MHNLYKALADSAAGCDFRNRIYVPAVKGKNVQDFIFIGFFAEVEFCTQGNSPSDSPGDCISVRYSSESCKSLQRVTERMSQIQVFSYVFFGKIFFHNFSFCL